MKVGSLFSGIGGADLGLERAGMKVSYQVEIDKFCQEVLEKNWPDVPRVEDIKEFDPNKKWYRKLTQEQVDSSVKMYESGMSLQEIGDYFRVSRQSMWDLLRRRTKLRSQKKYGKENHFYRGGSTADDHAQNVLETAIKQGNIIRQTICETCGSSGQMKDGRSLIQAHHYDYNKPLDVMWLCQKCHHLWHKDNKAIEVNEGRHTEELVDTKVDLIVGGFP